MTDSRRSRVIACFLALLLFVTISAGCQYFQRRSATPTEPGAAQVEKADTPEPLYYDFEDVLVPSELKVDKKRSFVYHAPGFTAGVLVLSGRVEVNSIIRFFENNMAKDNWRLVSVFKSPRTIMFFNKPNRSCIVNITEKQFKSEVEIWVAPIMESGSDLLK